jgi:hypothetical protein
MIPEEAFSKEAIPSTMMHTIGMKKKRSAEISRLKIALP